MFRSIKSAASRPNTSSERNSLATSSWASRQWVETMPNKMPDLEIGGLVCTAWIPASRYPPKSLLPAMKSHLPTSETMTL
jgi:hypothetical protein